MNPVLAVKPESRWVFNHLANVLLQRPRYERVIYAPLNGVLGQLFRIEDMFLIKPQHYIRPEASAIEVPFNPPQATRSGRPIVQPPPLQTYKENDSQADAAPRTSTDSYGYPVNERTESEKNLLIPDYIIARHNEQTKYDECLTIVEVKRNDDNIDRGTRQLERYINRMVEKMGKNGGVGGVLVAVETWIFVSPNGDVQSLRFQEVFEQDQSKKYGFSRVALAQMESVISGGVN